MNHIPMQATDSKNIHRQQGLSILVPVYNQNALPLAKSLSEQAKGLPCEIVLAEDGSTDCVCLQNNTEIGQLPYCRYIVHTHNVGRAAIRNYLAREALFDHLLLIDGDVSIDNKLFIRHWFQHLDDADVVVGSIRFANPHGIYSHNLKYQYECRYQTLHKTAERNRNPYQSFRTTHFLVRRDVLMRHPFDETFHEYGHEDTLWGKELEQNHISIKHLPIHITIADYDTNADFISKTEESLYTLKKHALQLQGYSTLLAYYNRLCRWHMDMLLRPMSFAVLSALKTNLTGRHPCTRLFNIYKLAYYFHIQNFRERPNNKRQKP